MRQSHPDAPAETALLRGAQHQLGLLPLPELRACAGCSARSSSLPCLPRRGRPADGGAAAALLAARPETARAVLGLVDR